jgi:Protein of unknown function (DUF1353)
MGFRRPQGQPNYPDYPPPPGTSPREPEVILRQVSPTTFQLLHGFLYDREGTRETYEVPAHDPYADPGKRNNSTDLASVPPLLSWFIGTYGLHTKAALFHDHYVDTPEAMSRKQADTLFRDALRESGVHWLRRWLMWTAVSLRTSFKRVGMIAVVGHLLALTGATAWWVLGSLAWWIPLVIGFAGFVWGLHRWPLAIVGFALVALPASLALVSRLIAWLTELVEEVLVVANAKRKGEERPFEKPMINPSARKSF